VAAANADYNRTKNAEHLNSFGRKLRELKVGDEVKIFAPPGHAEAVRRMRKQKHIDQWKGPMRIISKKSKTQFVVESKTGEIYERSITNIRAWRSGSKTTAQAKAAAPTEEPNPLPTFRAGEMVLAREEENANELDVCKITNVTNENVTLHCWGTTGRQQAKAKYTPVFINKMGETLLHKPRGRTKVTPFVWEISAEDTAALIPVRGVRLQKNGCLTSESMKALALVKPPSKLHRF